MNTNRRIFLKSAGLGGLAIAGTGIMSVSALASIPESGKLSLSGWIKGKKYRPLEKIAIKSNSKGRFRVYDGDGNAYFSSSEESHDFIFTIGGALGKHNVVLLGKNDQPLDIFRFNVDVSS